MTLKQIISRIQNQREKLHSEFKIKDLYIFGSTARGEASSKSDIDILVEFSSNEVGLFEFVRLKDFLESVLKRKVDLVARDALKEWMTAEIEKDYIRVA